MSELSDTGGLLGWLARDRKRGGAIIMGFAAVLAAGVVWLTARTGRDYLAVELLLGLLAALGLVMGVLFMARPRQGGSPIDEARLLILTLGGLAGFILTMVGITLLYQWWPSINEWLGQGERQAATWVLLPLVIAVAGLATMFASVQVAQSEVRISPVFRRLVYGYNAVLTGILLFLLLAFANVLTYLKLPAFLDSTETSFSRLSERSENILRSVDKPVQAYLMMSLDSRQYEDMRPLLANAQSVCPNLAVETVSPTLNSLKFDDLRKQYPQVTGQGLLLVAGEKGKEQAGFVKSTDIIKTAGPEKANFEGETAFISELSSLIEDRKKPIVYFASNNAGEFDFKDSTPTREDAIGTLIRRLGDRNFEVKPLRFEAVDPKVPDDATIVVLPRPTMSYAKPVADALKKFMDVRKGKLLALFGVNPDREGKAMADTGLEGLFAEYKVQLTKDRIITLPAEGAGRFFFDRCLYVAGEDSLRSNNPVVASYKNKALVFDNARQIKVAEQPGGNPTLKAEVLWETNPSMFVILEPDASASARQVCEGLMKQGRKAVEDRLAPGPVPMAIAVSENTPPPPGQPPSREANKPRLVVFGSSQWITNPNVDERSQTETYFSLFVSLLDWMREKSANIGVEPKQYKLFTLSPDANPVRLQWMPALISLLTITGLGAGVWIARRR